MSSIYSDTRLPDGSELTDNIRNFDMDRLLLFDEHEAYEGITRDGLYPVFANSFEVIVGDPLPVSYAKFSNDRAPRYRIRTELAENPRRILKYPLTKEAQEHVRRMAASYEKLRARFEPEEGNAAAARAETASRSIRIAPCRLMDDGSVCFDYVQGEPLETLLDACLLRHDKDGFLRLIEEYRERLSYRENLPAADQDMTFANLLVDEDVWTAVDYEWETDRCIPVNDLLYRALLLYRLENKRRARALDALLGEDFAEQICESLGRNTGRIAAVADRDSIIALSGAPKRELVDKQTSRELSEIMEQRRPYRYSGGNRLRAAESVDGYYLGVAAPILSEGDLMGCVMVLMDDKSAPVGETEQKVCQTVAGFLGKQMES